MKNFYYEVVKANSNKVHLTFVRVNKYEVHVILKVKEYIIPKVVENKSIKLSSKDQPTLIVVKCSKVISSKFKAVKFIA